MWGVLKYLYQHLGRFKVRFYLLFATGLLDGIATFSIPVFLAEFTKTALTASHRNRLITFLLVLYAASLFLQWIIRRYGESLGPQFGNDLRFRYFTAMEHLPIQRLLYYHSGYALSLINRVADGLGSLLPTTFWIFAKGISNLTLFFVFTARESLMIAIFNLILLAIFTAISAYLSRKMIPIASDLNHRSAALMEGYADFMANILTLKKLGIYPFAEGRISEKIRETNAQSIRLQHFHANRWFCLHLLFGIALLSTIGFILFQISKGETSASLLILFVAAYAVVRGNVEVLSENFKGLMEMKSYLTQLEEMLSPARLSQGNGQGDGQAMTWSEMRFQGVVLQYPGTSKRIVIEEFYLRKGEKICIIGKSGEGKTTLLNLLANLINPDHGRRLVDQLEYAEIRMDPFQRKFVFISQEVDLFNLSLWENITLGEKVDEKKMSALLERLDLTRWLTSLKKGLQTHVGEKGMRISSGQKQRINMARGILLNREIYLLDEPTSHLDTATEQKVIMLLREFLKDKTAVIVSHHAALRQLCDRCYVMKNHLLVEQK